MPSTINSTGTSSGIGMTADASGVLELQGSGNLGITIDATGAVWVGGGLVLTTLTGNIAARFRRITAPGPVAMLSTDYEVGIDQTIGATITVALPAVPVEGQRAQVSDVKGDAETFNITVTGAINGGTSYVISTNYGWVTVRYSGTQWNIIG